MKYRKQTSPVIGLLAILLSTACTASPPSGSSGGLLATSADKAATAAHAMVTGPEKRLVEFNKNLREALAEIVGTDNPNYGMSCDFPDGPGPKEEFNCDELSSSKADVVTIHLTFIRDRKRLEALVVAWNKLQTTAPDADLSLIIDGKVGAGDCGGKPNCVSAPWCAGPPIRCDKVAGAPCSPCT